MTVILVARHLQECARQADATDVTPTPTRTSPAIEEMLARTTQLAVALAADMRVSVLLVVDRDLRIRHAEGARWARIGIDPATMRGLRLTDFLPRELHDVVLPHYHAVLAGEIRRFTATWDHDFRNAIAPIPCEDGGIAGAIALAFDDGEELRAERAAKGELTRRLAQQAAVARLGELAPSRPVVASREPNSTMAVDTTPWTRSGRARQSGSLGRSSITTGPRA
jgi:hypothetical protein